MRDYMHRLEAGASSTDDDDLDAPTRIEKQRGIRQLEDGQWRTQESNPASVPYGS